MEVIPYPRQVRFVGSGFTFDDARVIRVSDSAADRLNAALLRDCFRQCAGVDCRIAPVAAAPGGLHWLTLSAGDAPAVAEPSFSPDAEREGYALNVTPAGVTLAARTEAGLFYGIQTLIQLAEQARRNRSPIPGMNVVDWPTFEIRSRYFDGSQYLGTVVTSRANLEREIKLLARYKLNCLNIEVYNLVPFQSFPHCSDANTLSLSDWQYLQALAHRYHVIILPSLQSFAQIYQVIWNCEEGKPYREETAPGLICPSRPENVRFLQGLYRDLMSVFTDTPALGVGCSEVGMQWRDHYCPRCRQRVDAGESLQDIYYKHVRNCTAAVDAAAKEVGRTVRPMIWADEFYCGYGGKRWVGIENVPRNVVMGHWQYWSRYQNLPDHTAVNYDGISGLLERGFDVLFLSASFEFNTYLHDLSPDDPREGKWDVLFSSGIYNIADQAKWAHVHNKAGYPGKVLGGGCATFSQHDIRGWDSTWYAYALQGEYAWGHPDRPLAELKDRFTDSFAATFYEARDAQTARTIADAYRDLDAAKSDIERNNYLIRDIIGEYDIHDNFYNDNNLVASLKLIETLRTEPKGPGRRIDDIRNRAGRVAETAKAYRSRLATLTDRVTNIESLYYLISAAHKIENHATRTLYLLDHEEVIHGLASAKGRVPADTLRSRIEALARRLDALRRDTQLIADEVDQLAFGPVEQLRWNEQGTEGRTVAAAGDTTGYHKVLESLAAFAAQLTDSKKALSSQLSQPGAP